MSYATMDHAGWVESNNAAINRNRAGRKGFEKLPETLSPFQRRVCDILGIALGGIYNVSTNWASVDWNCGGGVSLTILGRDLATFDFNQLTLLVFMAHEARIRFAIAPAMRDLRLIFHQRAAAGHMGQRHPNLEEAIANFRRYVPADHRIHYRAPAETSEAPA